nr:DNA-directed DNA polymerase [Tanacetum cinerariifolium]
MRTRSSSNLPVVSPPNPSTLNPKRRNRRRSKQHFILEESPIDTMADQRTMAELLCVPIEGYAEAIVFFGLEKDNPHDHIRAVRRWLEKEPPRSILTWEDLVPKFINEFFPPSRTTNLRNAISNFQQRFDESFHEAWDRYKDLLRTCPHHGFTELHQLDTFYNALNPTDQDSLNSAAGGNLLERRTQDVLTIIENKSKVHNSLNKSVVSQVKSVDANSNSSSEIAKLTHAVNQQTSACLATGGNTFPELRDNIQGYVAATVVNYNQGNSVYRPPDPKHRNRRRSKQPFILEESPVDTMADQRTMAELLRAPTEGYAEAIVVPPILAELFELKHRLINMMTSNQFFRLEKDNPHDHICWFNKITSTIKYKDVPNSAIKLMLFPFSLIGAACRWLEKEPSRSILTWEDLAWDRYKDLLRACPHHGFTELHQLDTFYNALNPADQDSLNVAAGGNLLERRTQDVLTIIENKSKVRNSQNKSVVSQVKSSDANSNSSSKIAKLTHAVNQQTRACLAADGNTFPELRDNIQGYVAAAVVNYNQGNSVYRPPSIANQNRPPGFAQPNVQKNQNHNTIANQKGELKAITTRSGIVIDGPSVPIPPLFINLKEDERVEETLTDQDLAEYTIKVPPPLLHINITLADALILIPKYQKMLKALIFNKEKLQELANTPLNENYSAVILKKLPKKLGDLGKFFVPYGFNELKCKALADLGASINLMPFYVWKKLALPELISTRMTLELANRAICTPAGIARDVFVPVGKFTLPTNFVIVNYESDPRVPLILGRPFLQTARALIDVHEEEMILRDEMFVDENALDYSPPPLFDEYDDDLFEVESNTKNVYDDPFDPKGEKIKESKLLIDELDLPCDFCLPSEYGSFFSEDFSKVDALPLTNNEDKCLAASGNTFPELRDNIQGYVAAAAVNRNQGNFVYRPPDQSYQAPTQQNQVVPLSELEKVKRMNEVNMKAMQTQINNVKNELRNELKNSIQASMSNQTNELKNIMGQDLSLATPLLTRRVNSKPSPLEVLHINITLADALILPKYQKMLKALHSNKEKLQELANTPLNENCSSVILKKLPEKLGDPGKFLISYGFS